MNSTCNDCGMNLADHCIICGSCCRFGDCDECPDDCEKTRNTSIFSVIYF